MIDTWNCSICGKEREDEFISVFKHDRSEEHNLPEGTFCENVKYCNDDLDCSAGAKDYTHFKKEEVKEEVKAVKNKALTFEETKEREVRNNNIKKRIITILLLFLAFNIFNSVLQHFFGDMTFLESLFYWPYMLLRLFLAVMLHFNIYYRNK